jgi:hypothetical protein
MQELDTIEVPEWHHQDTEQLIQGLNRILPTPLNADQELYIRYVRSRQYTDRLSKRSNPLVKLWRRLIWTLKENSI